MGYALHVTQINNMLFLKPEFAQKSETYQSLINQLNTQLYKIAVIKLNNIRFGFDTPVNYDKYEDILVYRDILNDIMYCATGLCNINTNLVISKVKSLINKPC